MDATETLKISWNDGKQVMFGSLPDSIFEGFYGGAAGGGKSYTLLTIPIVREFYKIPTFHGLILRRTFPELEAHQIQEAHKIYPLFGASYNQQKKRYKFPSGAIIDFGHAEYEADIRKYDSAEYHYIAPDELTSFTEFQYRYILSRCRTSDKRLPNIVRSASNPGNIGHAFVRDRFVKPFPSGGKVILDKITGLKRIFIQAFASDNPVLMQATPQYLKQLELLPEAEKQAKLYGNWWSFSGQVFTEFRALPYIDEPENACHVVDEMNIPDWTPKILTIDWGFKAMTYASWISIFPNKRVVMYREYGETNKTVEQWGTELAEKSLKDKNLFVIPVDPSAWQNRGTGTIIEQFSEAWKRVTGEYPPVCKADNDRLSGKMLIHDYLRWQQLPDVEQSATFNPDIAETILRLNGLEAYKSYIVQCSPKPIEKQILPRLLITKNCEIMIKTLPLCVYPDNKGINGTNVEDVSEFYGDDPYDNLRYALKACNSYFDKSGTNASQAELDEKRSQVCARLEQTKDMTKFYREMEYIERNTSGVIKPLRMFRRFGRH